MCEPPSLSVELLEQLHLLSDHLLSLNDEGDVYLLGTVLMGLPCLPGGCYETHVGGDR